MQLESFGFIEEAINAYLEGKCFQKAQQSLALVKNQQLSAKLSQLIDMQMKNHFKSKKNWQDLLKQGDVSGSLEVLAEQNLWDQCLTIAKQNGTR